MSNRVFRRDFATHGARRLPGALLAPILSAALAACGGDTARECPPSLRLGIEAIPTSVDPRLAADADGSRVAGLVTCSLVQPDRAGGWAPSLATSWQASGPRSWDFALRRDARFHDGSAVTADDVVATYRSVLDPRSASPKRGALRGIVSVEEVDGRVRLTLEQDNAAFLEAATLGVLPAPLAARPRVEARDLLGCGPFRVEGVAGDGVLRLRAFDGWYGGAVSLAAIEVRVVPDAVMRLLQLRSGELDLVQNALEPDAAAHLAAAASGVHPAASKSGVHLAASKSGVHLAASKSGVQVTFTDYDAYQYLGIHHGHPALADLRVRRAIAHAIDREAIVRHVLRGQAEVASTLLPPHHRDHEPRVRRYPFDPERARRLLDRAGYTDPDGDGPLPRLRLRYKTSTVELRRRIAEVIAANLRAVGIEVDIESNEWGTFYADIARGDFELFSLAWVGIRDADLLRLVFHSAMVPPAGNNRGRFANARMDSLTERGAREKDEVARRRLYARAQRVAARRLPYVPLWWPRHVVAVSERVEGFEPHPAGSLLGLAQARLRCKDDAANR